MKVRASITFRGTATENGNTGMVEKGRVLDVFPNRGNELIRAGLAAEVAADVPTTPEPSAAEPSAQSGQTEHTEEHS